MNRNQKKKEWRAAHGKRQTEALPIDARGAVRRKKNQGETVKKHHWWVLKDWVEREPEKAGKPPRKRLGRKVSAPVNAKRCL